MRNNLRCILLSTACTASIALASTGCNQGSVVDALVSRAYGAHAPPASTLTEGARPRLQILAGDMHCHVSPPDDPSDVSRGLAETVQLARDEQLDFVVLTPHVGARFFADRGAREAVVSSQARLREELAHVDRQGILFVPGFEYTDHRYGHVGVSFADLDAVLEGLPVEQLARRPELFFQSWIDHGGLLVVNHPLVTPLDSLVPIARADLSWRPMTSSGPFPSEIEAVDRLAQGFEVYNVTASELRDRFLLGDRDATLEATMSRLDGRIPLAHRRLTPLGGTDSHSHHLWATTFVLAEARTVEALHEGIVRGRTCVRDSAACSLELRHEGGSWLPVGSAIDEGGAFDIRAHGDPIDIIVNGTTIASPKSDEEVRLSLPRDACSVVRARVGNGVSSPMYVHCFVND